MGKEGDKDSVQKDVVNIVLEKFLKDIRSVFPTEYIGILLRTKMSYEALESSTAKMDFPITIFDNESNLLYERASSGERFGSLIFVDIRNQGQSVAIYQEDNNDVTARLTLDPKDMSCILGDLLLSGKMDKTASYRILDDIKTLSKWNDKHKDVLVNFTITSRPSGEVEIKKNNIDSLIMDITRQN